MLHIIKKFPKQQVNKIMTLSFTFEGILCNSLSGYLKNTRKYKHLKKLSQLYELAQCLYLKVCGRKFYLYV